MLRGLVLGAAISAVLAAAPTAACADYPTKPITLVVNYPSGGGSDAIARALARAMEKELKQTVVVENVAGGKATRGVTDVVTAAPDGYRIGVATNSPMTLAVHSVSGLPWSAPDSYDILGGIGSLYSVICAQPDMPFSSLEEMVAFAKANPGKLKVASIAGGLNQYTWDLFVEKAGINVRFVPYSGDADGMAAFLGKNTEIVNLTWPSLRGQVDAGRAKCLGMFAPERISSHPIPTLKELGYDVTTTSDYVVFAPKGLPADIRKILVEAVRAATADADLIKVLSAQSIVVKYEEGDVVARRFTQIYNDVLAQKAKSK